MSGPTPNWRPTIHVTEQADRPGDRTSRRQTAVHFDGTAADADLSPRQQRTREYSQGSEGSNSLGTSFAPNASQTASHHHDHAHAALVNDIACAHAAALNTSSPPMPFKPLIDYENIGEARCMMETHIRSLTRDALVEVTLRLHREIAELLLHNRAAIDALAQSMQDIGSPQFFSVAEASAGAHNGSETSNFALQSPLVAPTQFRSVQYTNNLTKVTDDAGMKVVNQYTFLKELGRGRYGKVKLAVDDHDQLVAIKVVPHTYVQESKRLRSSSDADGQSLSPMEREVKVMAKLKHRNIVRLREVIDDPSAKNIYLVMNYAERGPLMSLRPDGTSTPLQFEMARGFMRQMCEGLRYLHRNNVAHGDLTVGNCLLTASGIVCFSDFGVSSFISGSSQEFTQSYCTPVFAPPEVHSGGKFQPLPADIWALGVCYYCMVYGKLPFFGATMGDLRDAVINDELEFPEFDDAAIEQSLTSMNEASITSTDVPLRSGRTIMGHRDSEEPFCDTPTLDGGRMHDVRLYGGSAVDHSDLQDLLRHMLDKDPKTRYDIKEVKRHAFFNPGHDNRTRVSRLIHDGIVKVTKHRSNRSAEGPVHDVDSDGACGGSASPGADERELSLSQNRPVVVRFFSAPTPPPQPAGDSSGAVGGGGGGGGAAQRLRGSAHTTSNPEQAVASVPPRVAQQRATLRTDDFEVTSCEPTPKGPGRGDSLLGFNDKKILSLSGSRDLSGGSSDDNGQALCRRTSNDSAPS